MNMHFKQNLWKVLTLQLIGVVFVAVGIYLLDLAIEHYHDPNPTLKLLKYKAITVPIIIIAIILSSCMIIIYTIRYIQNKPVLIVNSNGMIDHSTIVSIGFISWSEIQNISLWRLSPIQTFIILDVTNFKRIINRLPAYKRRYITATAILGLPPIAINLNQVKEKPEDVLAVMNKFWNDWKENNKAKSHSGM